VVLLEGFSKNSHTTSPQDQPLLFWGQVRRIIYDGLSFALVQADSFTKFYCGQRFQREKMQLPNTACVVVWIWKATRRWMNNLNIVNE